jgi:hypothetical protein
MCISRLMVVSVVCFDTRSHAGFSQLVPVVTRRDGELA